jgi:ribonuclease Y
MGWGVVMVLCVLGGGGYAAWERLRAKRVAERARTIEQAAVLEAERTQREHREGLREAQERLGKDWERLRLELRGELEVESTPLPEREEEARLRAKTLEGRENRLRGLRQGLDREASEIDRLRVSVEELRRQYEQILLQRTEGTREEAATRYLALLEGEVVHQTNGRLARRLAHLEETSEDRARGIIEISLGRLRKDYEEEGRSATLDLQELGNGRGRSADRVSVLLQQVRDRLGVAAEVDEAGQTVHLRSSDVVCREVARRTLRKAAQRGCDQPAEIDRLIHACRRNVENESFLAAQSIGRRLGLASLHEDIVRAMGRLKFRTSHGQNVLAHSYEVARLGGFLAAELGLDVRTGIRSAFLHDLGKALEGEGVAVAQGMGNATGGHARVGAEFARRCGEDELVVNAIEAHHGDVPMQSLFPLLAGIADALSGARPGARREVSDLFLQRVEQLEEMARSCKGVDKVFVMHAGRSLRVAVKSDVVTDEGAAHLCEELVRRIDAEVAGPGCDVMVTRETRIVAHAR